jgi:hypothetical protein
MEVLTSRTTHIEFDMANVKVVKAEFCLDSEIRNVIIPGLHKTHAIDKKLGDDWEYATVFSIKGVDQRPYALMVNSKTGEYLAFWYKDYHSCAMAA